MRADELQGRLQSLVRRLKQFDGAALPITTPDIGDSLQREYGAIAAFVRVLDKDFDLSFAQVSNTRAMFLKLDALDDCRRRLNMMIGHLSALASDSEIVPEGYIPASPQMKKNEAIASYLSQLHPKISKICAKLYTDGHYAQAVNEAAKAVFEYVRERSGVTGDGTELVQHVFSVNKPVLQFSELKTATERNEQVGFMDMLKGYALGVRNVTAHTHDRTEDPQMAFEHLVMASLLCRRIDDANKDAVAYISS